MPVNITEKTELYGLDPGGEQERGLFHRDSDCFTSRLEVRNNQDGLVMTPTHPPRLLQLSGYTYFVRRWHDTERNKGKPWILAFARMTTGAFE
jgi:hypothetical protein